MSVNLIDIPTDWLPRPFRNHTYRIERSGVQDSEAISVYMSESGEFAFLYPQPNFDYKNYEPRVKRLGLQLYKGQSQDIERRLEKVAPFFEVG